MFKKLVTIVLVMLMSFLLAGCGGSSGGEEKKSAGGDGTYTIKIGSPVVETHPAHNGFLKFIELVEKNSNGKIKAELHANGVLGGDRELTEAVQMGTVTMTLSSTSPVANFEKSFYLFDLPFLFPDRETAYKVLDGPIGQKLLDNLASQGIKGLGYWENGFRHITNSKRSINKLEDIKGLKLRTMENQLHMAAWKQLGANPTPMAFGEVFTALQQGTVDGQENPLALIDSNKFYEANKYLTLSGHIYTPFVIMMNKKFFDELPQDLQKVVLDAVKEAGQYQRDLMKQQEEKSLKVIKDAGCVVNELPAEEKAKMVEALKPVYDKGAEMMGGRQLIDELMAEVEKVKK
ncbi:TRAP transporter substrate-binding protein [Desulforamulus putei]|uniref:TRAP transporter substrate-binding protein n=1 Tax=Desulforamulus putei TaxID=74701 RepID=UPI002FDCB452